MEVNREYLNEFCEAHRVFSNGYLAGRSKEIIKYYFGVPAEKLNENKITNINQLEEVIKNFGKEPSEADQDSNKELEELGKTLEAIN